MWLYLFAPVASVYSSMTILNLIDDNDDEILYTPIHGEWTAFHRHAAPPESSKTIFWHQAAAENGKK